MLYAERIRCDLYLYNKLQSRVARICMGKHINLMIGGRRNKDNIKLDVKY